MKTYQPVLLCGWFADFTFNICALIGRPLYYYHDGVMFMISSMFVSTSSSRLINHAGIIIWIYGFMQLMVMPALQFLARYLMVVWNMQLRTQRLLMLLLLCYIVPISYSALCYATCTDSLHYQQLALKVFGKDVMSIERDNGTFETRFVLSCDIGSPLTILLFGYAFAQIFVIYGLILFFGWKIYTHLKVAVNKPKMQHIQKQITNILLVQAITPPLMGGLPLVYILFMAMLKIDSLPWAVEAFDRILALVPIVNPILAIYFVKHYRQTVASFFFCCSPEQTNQVTTVHTTNPTHDSSNLSEVLA
ncbi:hypothetical protein M3Y97_00003100 [Aphelenchoides bicaudatus]|nr:hypothetical protein M3Y97_00003100 [Aphelenchoides bicaudatus]